MKRGQRLPDDQAEIVFSDVLVEQLENRTTAEQQDVLASIVRLCTDPAGKHPLSHALAGWNTLEVLAGHARVVYKVSQMDGVGLVEVLCLGPRSADEVYDMAVALTRSGALAPAEVTQVWEALALLEVVAEAVGLDGWDFTPLPAPAGMVRSAVAAQLLPEAQARLLSKDELEAAMEAGWASGAADPVAAIRAALERARGRVGFVGRDVLAERAEQQPRPERRGRPAHPIAGGRDDHREKHQRERKPEQEADIGGAPGAERPGQRTLHGVTRHLPQ